MSTLIKNTETIQSLKIDTENIFNHEEGEKEGVAREVIFRRESNSILFQMYADEEEDFFI
ncbi:hypothetical protein [Flavobacterium hercynium]|uniref:Uncharacterized protein n=1 Tax=Flavobacterium hercynium TaxID=387094 RepID=A0A226HGC6_9FLAO|nr:hypothetical protein [Flavobacterium hercynium]OXA92918.1 hypothetical protein B0A66_09115 [Flavobacterium hercynium]SMP03203.1 hypothetical protein SAMN06265346_101256 [Flavobacterium hercynium]